MGCLFGYCGRPSKGLLNRMAKILKHRCKQGWEQERLTQSNDHVFEIGHGIPMWSSDSQVGKISERNTAFGYSGVFFNAKQVVHSETKSASEILDAMKNEPENQLQSLEGVFTAAFACEDKSFLIRDPAGVKVLYWTLNRERLVFASEIKALFADTSVPRKMRMAALPEYLTFSFIPGERTMFEDIYELQPGTTLKYQQGKVSLQRHFVFENAEWDGKHPRAEHDYAEQVRSDLEISVRECCAVNNNGMPPSVFLSGGIDSSAVLAVAANQFPGVPIKTFSVHFGPRYANENEYVSMMAERYHTDHTWIEIRPSNFIKRMRQIIWKLDDPIGDPITVPNFLLSEAASRVSPLVLNGEGGDPCFGGPKNIPMILSNIYGQLPGESADSWLEQDYLFSYRKCFDDLENMLNPDVLKASGGREALAAIITPFLKSAVPRQFLNKLMTINIRLKGANLILVKVDKMSSANGLLALPPLFSKRIIETSMACPPNLKLVGNVEKGILKNAVEDIVPYPIIQRPKSGMMVPVRFWFRGEMRRYAKKVLSKKNLSRAGFFNIPYVRSLLNYDKSEIQSYRCGLKLWMLITFMFWYEQMAERRSLYMSD
ncbi:asparagine synthase [Desulfonema magnum]|uniref:asparagine synthase (glutamine-hydrolyzing) n=1 Tax=Desulfonema magnum TaxID=45655 RepID=A0A975BTQ6_9BACT|nr:asparagine synthase-related protein [Desulfonema magnum]QTA91293.1 Asparagine synthetase [Desulfonema magnum]